MIRYQVATPKDIKSGLLNGYQRFTETNRVKYIKDNILKEKDTYFIDDWDSEKLNEIVQYMKEPQNMTTLAKKNRQVVGFVVIDIRIFDGYMNVPYIHTDNRYRGQNIGKNMMLLTSKIAKDKGASKLYISGHPDCNTQAFYSKIGCVLAEKINQTLYEIEPLDIQLELSLDYIEIMMRKIKLEFSPYKHISSTLLNKLLPRVFSVMPEADKAFLDTVKPLLVSNERSYFSMGTLLLKKKETVIHKQYFDYYEDILFSHFHG